MDGDVAVAGLGGGAVEEAEAEVGAGVDGRVRGGGQEGADVEVGVGGEVHLLLAGGQGRVGGDLLGAADHGRDGGVGVDGAVGDDELGGVAGEEVEGVAQVADARDASLASARAGRVGHVLSVPAPARGGGLIVVQVEVRAEAVLTW